MKYNLWIWEDSVWCVINSYETNKEAYDAAHESTRPWDTWTVTKINTQKDRLLRDNPTIKDVPFLKLS